jgi:hypothetical protein
MGSGKNQMKELTQKNNNEWQIKILEITKVIFKTNERFYIKQINKKNKT